MSSMRSSSVRFIESVLKSHETTDCKYVQTLFDIIEPPGIDVYAKASFHIIRRSDHESLFLSWNHFGSRCLIDRTDHVSCQRLMYLRDVPLLDQCRTRVPPSPRPNDPSDEQSKPKQRPKDRHTPSHPQYQQNPFLIDTFFSPDPGPSRYLTGLSRTSTKEGLEPECELKSMKRY